jgi:1-acyl-sn-glycerol-3-phosphate acyltransferase
MIEGPTSHVVWWRRTPRWLRLVLMGALFLLFFLGSPVIALVIFPLVRLTSSTVDRYRARCTHLLYLGTRFIFWVARFIGVADYDPLPFPASVDRSKPYVLISNHPTFIDMILLMGSFGELTCVTKGSWSRHWALGRLLRATNYLPGPGSGIAESDDMLASMTAHLRAGFPLLVFPEGHRSHPDRLRRFRRGAVYAAAAANVPIVPLYLWLDRPYLTSDISIWHPPKVAPKYLSECFDPIFPDSFDRDAKRIQAHVEQLYTSRFVAGAQKS